MTTNKTLNAQRAGLYKLALLLTLITIFYNIAEGLISIYFGLQDETLSLFGFGLDSFVEVFSGVGIWHMLSRIKAFNEERDEFEIRALRITGSAFYMLTVGLIFTAAYNIMVAHKPDTTFWGVIISIISIVSMSLLIHFKLKVGRELGSQAIIADANCTKTCLYLSFVLLAASIGYELTGIGWIDSIGAIMISYYSYKEGKEAFEKIRTGKSCGCEH